MIKKIAHITLLLASLSLLVTKCNSHDQSAELKQIHHEDLKWMQQTSKIQFPADAELISVSKAHEWGMIVKMVLREESIETFSSSYAFSRVRPEHFILRLSQDLSEPWSSIEKEIEESADFRFLRDCNTVNIWSALLNHTTGELYFEIIYPDAGGDIINCD